MSAGMQESTVLKGETRSFLQHRKLHILPLKLEILIGFILMYYK